MSLPKSSDDSCTNILSHVKAFIGYERRHIVPSINFNPLSANPTNGQTHFNAWCPLKGLTYIQLSFAGLFEYV